ncbi:MAG: VWA domain-containing protein, partial [Acidimicrobiales bacterium]
MSARRLRVLAAGGVGLLALLIAAGPATATAPTAPILVRRVDTTKMPNVTVDVETGSHQLSASGTILVENGTKVAASSVQTFGNAQVATATVLVVDTAATMNGGRMSATRLALKQLIAAKGPADQMAVVAFGTNARTVQQFSADPAVLDAAVDRLAVGGNAVLNDGVLLGANLLAEQPGALPQMVIVTDGDDKGSAATAATAEADLLSSNALTYTVGLRFIPGIDFAGAAAFASAGGGSILTATDAVTTTDAMRQVIQDFKGQYRITYRSRIATGHAADLVITAPGLAGRAQIVPGGIALGSATDPAPIHLHEAPGALRGKAGSGDHQVGGVAGRNPGPIGDPVLALEVLDDLPH